MLIYNLNCNFLLWRVGRGRESWDRSEGAVEFNNNKRHLHHSPVSSPTEELQKDKRRSDDSGRREKTRPGLLFCVLCAAVIHEELRLTFISFHYLFILLLQSLNVRRFPPPSSHIYELFYNNMYQKYLYIFVFFPQNVQPYVMP